MKKNKNGFSLVELIVGLVIMSIFLTMLIPVMTKKTKKQNIAIAPVKTNISSDCYKVDPQCLLCENGECLLCSNQIINLGGKYVIPKNHCEERVCPENCFKCDEKECFECLEGYTLSQDKQICSLDD